MSGSKEQILKYVNADESKEKHLRQAADCAKKCGLDFVWISVSDLEHDDLDSELSVFVLDPFEGKHFEFLKENKCRIVGPQCVISCLQTRTPLPFVAHPVYTVAMRGVFACCTSVPKNERDELHELIRLMGGIVMRDFTDAVTHLVAGEVGSKKYRVACNLSKPVLLPSWVYKCWELGKDTHVCSTDKEFQEHACPLFKGFTVCVTGLEAEKRKDVKRLVTEFGGTYSGELNMNTCTHLIVDIPRGEKYEFARKWKIHRVSCQWLYDSINSGYCLDETSYQTLPDDGQHCSPLGSRLSSSRSLNSTSFTAKSKDQKRISKKATQVAYKSAQVLGDGDLIAGTSGKKKQNLDSDRTMNVFQAAVARSTPSILEDKDFNVRLQPGNMFLDGCKIYLGNFSDPQLEKLRKIINCGGGTRFDLINETVSHIVVGDNVGSELDILRNCDFQPLVVTVQWILDSAKAGKRLPEDGKLHLNLRSRPYSLRMECSLIIYLCCIIAKYCFSYLVTSRFQFSSCTLSVYLRLLVVSFV